MKNFILGSLLVGTCILGSCSTERMSINSVENLKSAEMKNYDNALKSLMKPENRSTPTEKNRHGAQLNDRSLEILYYAAKNLLTANGETVAIAETRSEKELAISRATKMYFEKLGKISRNVNNEN